MVGAWSLLLADVDALKAARPLLVVDDDLIFRADYLTIDSEPVGGLPFALGSDCARALAILQGPHPNIDLGWTAEAFSW